MNYANPFTKTSYASLFNSKEHPSTLTSFLSQNQSIRSNNTQKLIPSRQCFTPQQHLKKTELKSPRQKIVTLHEERRPQKKSNERVKHVSEHSSMPYLYISKKSHEIRIPILPKLSPEPKIEISRLPYINIMTEPTAAIEEHSDEGQTPQDRSMEDSQKLLNKSKSFLQVSQISQNQDELSNSKISLKSRFKQAVQKSFRSPPRKSLFNILISHEFNTLHEKERNSLQVKFEPGNQVLAAKFEYKKKNQKLKKCIKGGDIKKKVRFINMEQFQISTKAFQRKINLIHCTSSRNLVNFEQFSLLPKNSRKSFFMSNERNNVVVQKDSPLEKSNHFAEIKLKEKFKITITYENVDQFTYQFFKPKHMKEQEIEETPIIQSVTPKNTSPIMPLALIASSKRLPSGTSKKIDFNQSFVNIKTKRMSRLSFQQINISDDQQDKSEQRNDFSKPGLFVRVYYQNKLYKLLQKTNYTKDNLQEVEFSFRPKIAQPNSSTLLTTIYTVMSTTEQGIRQRKVTNEGLQDRIQFLGIKFPKYFLENIDNVFEYNDESSSAGSQSSEDSDSDGSLDKLLESPLMPNKPQVITKKSSKKQKTIIKLTTSIQAQTVFFNDPPIDQKQLSTGSLILIKKIRKTFQIPVFLQPILSTLEQSSKNRLLTFDASLICENFQGTPLPDFNQVAFENLIPFYRNKTLIRILYQAIEIRYSQILTGRFLSSTRMYDVEHQEPQLQTILSERQEPKIEKSDIQFQHSSVSTKAIPKIATKDSFHDSVNQKNFQLQNLKSKYTSQRNLTKQGSLQVNQPQLLNKRTMNSGDISNQQTLQQSNQQNSNLFTQTSTVLITKPTQTSQQSVFRVMSSKHIDLNSSQQDISSSFHSSQNDESPKSGKQFKTQNSQRQPSGSQKEQQISNRKTPSQNEMSQGLVIDHHNKFIQYQEIHNPLSMYMYSLRMRTHIKESQRRQKLDQAHLVKLAIYDHNFTEFMDNIQLIPEMQLDMQFERGNTFLILAAQCGCYDIVHELIKRGVDINIQNDDGNTAVHMALAYGHYKIGDMLMEAGGSTHIINKRGQNAWSIL